MVKAGGRSKWNSANGPYGSSSASSSSPKTRLKKGGKRRRRLCYKEGCTLCPSFGYEGSVAVSCSRHKEAGMRNLTARRCQHMGCFTAANFGIPGDKPRFCIAHSVKGMVNRNKPRGREGIEMMVSRILRRTANKRNGVRNDNIANNKESLVLEVAAAAEADTSEGSAGVGNRPVSSGEDTLMYVGDAGKGLEINEEDQYEALLSRALRNARPRGVESSAVTVGDAGASVVNGSPVPSMALTNRGDRSNGIMSHKHSLSSMSVGIPMAPWESRSRSGGLCRTASAAFVSRGEGLDGPSAGGSGEKPPGGIVGVPSGGNGGNGGRARSGDVEKDLETAKIPRVPLPHDAFIVAPRVETDDFEKYTQPNARGLLGGVPDRRGVRNAPFDLSFAGDGDIMNGGGPSDVMDSLNSFDDGDKMDSDVGFQIGATLEDILGVGRDDDVAEYFDSKESHEQEPLLGRCSDQSANASTMRSSVGLSLNGLLPTVDDVIGVGEVRNGSNFEIDHLLELKSVFLNELHKENACQDTRHQQQQGHYLCSGASNSRNSLGGIRVESDIGDMSSVSLTLSSSSTMTTGIMNGSLVDTAVRSMSTPATPTPTPILVTPRSGPSAPRTPEAPDALISPKHSQEQAWWDGQDGKYVAMSEPVSGPTAAVQELASAGDIIGNSIYHDYGSLGGEHAGRRAGGTNGVAPGVSIEVGFSLDSCRVNGGDGTRGGGAFLSPLQKRHQDSLGGKYNRFP